MATSTEFHDYVAECLAPIGGCATRKMMGDYCLYFYGKVIGLICDNQLFLKPTPSVLRLFPDADRSYPYDGSKTLMVIVEDLENTELLAEAFNAMLPEIPDKKK